MSEETPDTGARPGRRRLTPVDVQQQVFRRAALRGYNEQDVDDFLDEVTEELSFLLEEQRRLREQGQGGVTEQLTGGQDVAEAKRMADDIVRKAREEAAEILRRARAEQPAGAPAGGTSVLQPFLAQERVFLQDLSKLIQGHADTVRDMARARRRTTGGRAPAGPAGPAGNPAQEAPPPSRPERAAQSAAQAEEPAAHVESAASGEPGAGQQTEASLKELFWGEE